MKYFYSKLFVVFFILLSFISIISTDDSVWCDGDSKQNSLYNSLMGFYLHTESDSWTFDYLWGSEECPCSWYGIDCKSSNTTVALNLNFNGITGYISESFCANIYDYINLSNNELYQELPDCFGDMDKLTDLKLSNNSFQGILPSDLGNLSKLKHFEVDKNSFAGPFPSYIQCPSNYFSEKISLDFSDNLFWCPSPDWCTDDDCAACEPEPSESCTSLNYAACEDSLSCCYSTSWGSSCDDFINKEGSECTDMPVEECEFNSSDNSKSSNNSSIWWIILGVFIVTILIIIGGSIAFYITYQKRNFSFFKNRHQLVKIDSETYLDEDSIYQDDVPPRSSLDYEL